MIINVNYVDKPCYKGFYYSIVKEDVPLLVYSSYNAALAAYKRLGGIMPPKIEQGVTR